jgi:hypothetical protein
LRNIPHATAIISIVLVDSDGDTYPPPVDCDDSDPTVNIPENAEPTSISYTGEFVVMVHDYTEPTPRGDVNVSAMLVDAGGQSIAYEEVSIEVYDEDNNWMGSALPSTDPSGIAEAKIEQIPVGVYRIVTQFIGDDCYYGSSEDFTLLAVCDPSGGFVTGGGWIDSPQGAYTSDPTLTGKANFGFVSKYKKGPTVPTGQTEFQFKVADLNFHSDSYEWLVVAGAKAQYKGVGTINGEGSYKFILVAVDADINENDAHETDKFRIKIWEENEPDVEDIVYDNGLDGDVNDEFATTEIGGGQIKIHN